MFLMLLLLLMLCRALLLVAGHQQQMITIELALFGHFLLARRQQVANAGLLC